jgi:hypothetical protein
MSSEPAHQKPKPLTERTLRKRARSLMGTVVRVDMRQATPYYGVCHGLEVIEEDGRKNSYLRMTSIRPEGATAFRIMLRAVARIEVYKAPISHDVHDA